MSGLRALQQWFHGAMTEPGRVPLDRAAAASKLTHGPRLSAAERFGIYQSSYWARLVECLEGDYPTVRRALGEEAFDALARGYVARYPSLGPNLNAYGDKLSAFARARGAEPLQPGFVADLAALEWAIVEVIHAPESPALDAAELSKIPPESWDRACFTPGSAVRLLELSYPVNAYFQAVMDDGAPEIPAAAASCTAVYRHGLTVWRWDMTRAMTTVLLALRRGATLGEALGALEPDPAMLDEAGRSLTGWFQEWVSRGFFERVSLKEPEPGAEP